MLETKARIAVLVGPKSAGSNMANLILAGRDGRMFAEVVLVIAPKGEASSISHAQSLGVEVAIENPDEAHYDERLFKQFNRHQIDLICLAGYLRLLPVHILEAFPNRVLNIHPALLPLHGGKGMYGKRVHEAVLSAHERESGCTVHFVSDAYDSGQRILQLRCPVLEEDTPETLGARVLALEHQAYPEAVNQVLAHGSELNSRTP